MGIKSNTFCLYERKKIKVFYNNNFDKVCVVLLFVHNNAGMPFHF